MNLVKYRKKLPSILDEFFNESSFFNDCCLPTKEFNHFVPMGDVIETDDAFNVELMMPGFEKTDIKMNVEEDSLLIKAERKKSESKYNTIESSFGSFKKSYLLPNYVDKNKIDVTYVNGVLKIIIPKIKEKVGKKSIEIK
jgi:HSP20 family protein